MNELPELSELYPTQNSQEVLSMLPYDHASLEAALGRSKDFIANYAVDCAASLDAEKHRVVCVEAVTGVAVQHSLDLQEKQRGIYTELADADDCYVALLDTKQAIEAEEAEKQSQLALEQTEQTELNQKAAGINAELANYATNTPGYHRILQDRRSHLGQDFVASGAKISQLQAEIDGIRSDELPALEARIAKELAHIMQLYAAVLSVTEQIGNLPAPADDPKNRILYQNSSGSSYVKPTMDNATLVAPAELTTHETGAERHRKLGASAVSKAVEDKDGFLRRIVVSFKQLSVDA